MAEIPAGILLDWMSNSSNSLSLFRERDGDWVVVDTQFGDVLGTGGSAKEALSNGYDKTQLAAEARMNGSHSLQAG